jgi:hypothetical protein
MGWVWWYIPVIPAFGKMRQEDQDFKAFLNSTTRPYFKKQQNKQTKIRRMTVCISVLYMCVFKYRYKLMYKHTHNFMYF